VIGPTENIPIRQHRGPRRRQGGKRVSDARRSAEGPDIDKTCISYQYLSNLEANLRLGPKKLTPSPPQLCTSSYYGRFISII
jgi:hypothetical protein